MQKASVSVLWVALVISALESGYVDSQTHDVILLGSSAARAIRVQREPSIANSASSRLTSDHDIGPPFHHSFVIANQGRHQSAATKMTVLWPQSVVDNHGNPKWLTYLTKDATVAARESRTSCRLASGVVNPLDVTISSASESMYELQENEDVLLRKTESQRRSLRLDCDRARVKCVKFDCDIPEILPGGNVTMIVSARLWKTTLLEDLTAFRVVLIRSEAFLAVQPLISSAKLELVTTTAELAVLMDDLPNKEHAEHWVAPFVGMVGIILLFISAIFFHRSRTHKSPSLLPSAKVTFVQKRGHQKNKTVVFLEEEERLQATSTV